MKVVSLEFSPLILIEDLKAVYFAPPAIAFSLKALVAQATSEGSAPLTSHTSIINALEGKIEIAINEKAIAKILKNLIMLYSPKL